MIAFIQGELCDAGQDMIVVACHGIGYEIQIPVSVAQVLPDPGNVVKIYTYTYVREDALGLFGFLTQDDLKIFKLLITVNGVGPKAALAILSAICNISGRCQGNCQGSGDRTEDGEANDY